MFRYFFNTEVLNAFLEAPRYLFPEPNLAYSDPALPIIHNQTISHPCIVALMTQITELGKMIFPFAEFSLSKVNCLTKNKNEALGEKIIPRLQFVPITGEVPK